MGRLVNICAGADLKSLPKKPVEAILLNALDHGSTKGKVERAKEMCQKAGMNYKLSDSSGYQIHRREIKGKPMTFDPDMPMKYTSRELNISPRHVMEIAGIHCSDIVVGLDFAVRKFKSTEKNLAQLKQAEFVKKLKYNVPWAYESAKWKGVFIPQAQFFLPIQCYSLDHVDVYLRKTHGIQYDGVSFPIRNIKDDEIVQFLVDFYRRGITRVHLLGTSSFYVIALCAYMAANLFEWVSLDSTTWRIAADKSGFLNPWDLSRVDLRTSKVIPKTAENDCPCPYCGGQSYSELQALPSAEKKDVLRQHNWWVVDRAFADLRANSTDIYQLDRFLRNRCKDLRRADKLIETLMLVDALKYDKIFILQSLLCSK
jgi:queuine/archaeosine tRNA-ribosyltransferase